ncbi:MULTISPECIES: hypothetical protein [unclassified Arthrobacter]|uniref:hypothetical protein n=1 Tax=unclassified Arthrobacter TaxID=235627 RepID=UPI001C85C8DD|nr:hypothetical protein [Arthrobacter sp. MAHUQ-56]MBX7444705.1 hypothetical protein [Arthrobacter sp. MAHUQ-56]
MPSRLSLFSRARRASGTVRRSTLPAAVSAGVLGLAAVFGLAGCSSTSSVENADVPKWRATALPEAPGVVLQDSGKILNRDRTVQQAATVPAGRYTLTLVCDGSGKAFFDVTLDGKAVAEAGAACNGSRETTRISLPTAGRVEISGASVDAPLVYAYQLAPAQ